MVLTVGSTQGDCFRDQLTVKPSIFNENLVSVHTSNNYAGEVNSSAIAIQSLRICAWTLGFGLKGNPVCGQILIVEMVLD